MLREVRVNVDLVTPTLRNIVAGVVAIAGFAGAVIVVLVVAFDLRVEPAGSGIPLIFSFGDPDDHFAALEESRAQPRAHAPAPGGRTKAVGPPTPSVNTTTGTAPVAAAAPATPAAYWTDFRGPNRDGRYAEMAIRTDWPGTGLEPLWNQPIGGGYASFVVAEGRAFTIEQRRRREVVAAYDVETGRELWTHAWDAHFQETMGGPGPRATPTWHEGRLYALGATGALWCLDADTGTVVWERNILADGDAANLAWAMSASPLIVDEMVVVLPGGSDAWSVAAYDRLTGDIVWHVLNDIQGYTSPMVVNLDGVRQILVVTAARVAGLRIEDGQLLWDHPWVVSNVPNMSQPLVIAENRLFLSASYGKGAMLLDVSRTGDSFTVETVWQNNRMKNRFSSSVLRDGYIYGLDNAILACLDAATGELMWKGGRYGYGQLLLAGDHLVIITERGDLVLVRATPESHQEVAGFRAIEGKTWNVPALADGRLLLRNAREMAAFDLRPGE